MASVILPNATQPLDFTAQLSGQVPILFPGILFIIFIAILGAGNYSQ